ncbi:MAG TPA: AAA family ATPase [Nocardioides sp.]|nr:AAA family ATPase [Nocardioides sp.]
MDECEIVERDAEQEALREALARAAWGDGGVVVVEGPAGIGKSTLLDVAVQAAGERGFRRLRGGGGEVARAVPFAVARDVLGPALRAGSPWVRDEVLRDAARLALPALEPTPGSGATEAPEARASAIHGLTWLSINLASSPLLLAIDDLHAADAESLDWLTYLAGRLDGVPLMVLAALRRPRSGSKADLLVARVPAERRLRPGPLSRDAVVTLSRQRGEPLDVERAAVVVAATGGKPFLVEAMLADRSASSDPLRGVVQRVADAGPAGLDVACAAAVLGDDASVRHVAAVAGIRVDHVGRTVGALAAASLVAGTDPIRLVHPLLEEALLEAATEDQRSDWHARAAEVLAADGALPGKVAAHLVRTLPSDDPRHRDWLAAAVDAATSAGAPATAAVYLRRLLEEDLAPSARAAALHRLGLAEAQCFVPGATDHLVAATSLTTAGEERARVQLDLSTALLVAGDLAGGLEVLLAAVESLRPDTDAGLAALADALGLSLLNIADEQALDALEEQVRAHRRYDGSPADRRAAAALSFAGFRVGAPAQECLGEARYAFDQPTADLALAGLAPAYLGAHVTLTNAGAADEAHALAVRGGRWASQRGAPALASMAAFREADAAFVRGDLHDVLAFGEHHFAAAEEGLFPLLVTGAAVPLCVRALVDHGDPAAARDVLDRFGMWDLDLEELGFASPLLSRGVVKLALRQPAAALLDLQACGRRMVATGHHCTAGLPWRIFAVEALALLGRVGEARDLADVEVEKGRAFGAAHVLGRALVARARLEPGAEAEQLLVEAVGLLAGSGCRLELAEALVAYGAHLRRTGNRREARLHLREARELAHACHATPLRRVAEEELAASGARVVQRPTAGVGALTPSERRVADLAASGLSNAQIAQTLFVSLKTVEMHLGNTYQKLGIRQRSELVRTLAAAG